MKYGTPFCESEALLAVVNADWDHVKTLADDMSPHEMKALAQYAYALGNFMDDAWRETL